MGFLTKSIVLIVASVSVFFGLLLSGELSRLGLFRYLAKSVPRYVCAIQNTFILGAYILSDSYPSNVDWFDTCDANT